MKSSKTQSLYHAAATILGLLLVACGPPHHAPRVAAPLPRLVLVPFTLEPVPIDGVSVSDTGAIAQVLAVEATSTAQWALVEQRVGISVELSSTAARNPTPEALRVIGIVRVPFALPEGLVGLQADQRKGSLVVAIIRLTTADGTVIREAEGIVTWSDADWLKGGRRRRNRPVQTVLQEAVHAGVELAVRHLESR